MPKKPHTSDHFNKPPLDLSLFPLCFLSLQLFRTQKMQAVGPLLSLSPSFNSHSSNKLADIAARVVREFSQESKFDEFHAEIEQNFDKSEGDVNNDEDDEAEEEFEFSFVGKDSQMSPISADEIFYNGQIRPVFPLFDTSLLHSEDKRQTIETHELNPSPKPIRFPLKKLLFEERDPPSSSSSSEADDLEGISPETYCVWTPKARAEERCKKSNSTGSSKRWKFKDLHNQRSNSDGKDSFVFLTPSNSWKIKKNKEEEKPSKEVVKSENDVVTRRSFLPYRQDLVGFFTNVNGLSRNLHPF